MEGGEIRSLLINHKIISIQSSSGWDSVPPFHEEVRSLPNLLCITLDDYFAIPDDEDEKKLVALFSYEIADQIMRFVDDGKMAEEGTPEEIFENPKSERLKTFLSKVL